MLVQFLKMFMWLRTWKKLKFKDIKGILIQEKITILTKRREIFLSSLCYNVKKGERMRTIIITGASGGLAQEMVKLLSKDKLILVGRS